MADDFKNKLLGEADRESRRRTALVTGSVALGALATSSLFRKLRNLKLCAPQQLPPAIDAKASEMEFMEGSARFYQRDGSGVPIVLLHSINAAASSHEMKPIFEHLAERTTRPVYALDWLGFGRSDRPPVYYSPMLYQRQLRRFLSEHVRQPADIISLSLSCEYTAELARSLPYLVHKLVFISPTGVSNSDGISMWQRALVAAAGSVGAFEIFFYRLTRPEVLRSFFQRQVFVRGRVPDDLINYARATTLVHGAYHAPRYFTQGRLTNGPAALQAYVQLQIPTLVIVPQSDETLIQHFDRAGDLAAGNPEFIQLERIDTGLMPQWESPQDLFSVLDEFLIAE